MARRPFFSGNYGSALGSTAQAADIIARAGQQRGQALAGMGAQIGGMIQQYGLNKEKRAELTGEIEAMLPKYMQELTMSGNEDSDKKNIQRIEKFRKGDSSMADLRGLAGELAMKDKVQARTAQNEAARIANEMGQVNLSMAQQLKDTKINIAKNQGVMSDLATNLAQETDPKKRELLGLELQNLIDSITRLGQPRIEAEEAELKAVPGQVERKEKLGELQLKAAKRADTSADLLLRAFGGAKEKAEFDYQGAKISRKNLKKGLEYLDARIDYTNYLSTAKNVPIDTKKEYASLVAHSGKIVDTLVEDPITGNQITFQEYMEKANEEPRLYPLTGKGSGAAGVLYGNFQDTQKQIIDFGKTILVQANVPEELVNPEQVVDPSILARIQAGNRRKPLPFDPLAKSQSRGSR